MWSVEGGGVVCGRGGGQVNFDKNPNLKGAGGVRGDLGVG